MAMKCQKRNGNNKREKSQINEREKMNFATVSQIIPSATSMTIPKVPIATRAELLQIHAYVAHAQNQEQRKPGTYRYELSRVLKANNLPSIIIPDDKHEIISNNAQQQAASALTINVTKQDAGAHLKTPTLKRITSTESL